MSAFQELKGAARTRAAAGVAVALTMMALAAGNTMLTAAPASTRLLSVSTQDNVVVIEATDPVAYTVNRADPTTLVVDLRDVSVADAANRVQPQGLVSGVRLEQATATDGVSVARVRVSLNKAAEYAVKSARNTIRLELASGVRQTNPDGAAPAGPAPGSSASAKTARSTSPATAPASGSSTAANERVRAVRNRTSSAGTAGRSGRSTEEAIAALDAGGGTVTQAPAASKEADGVEAITALTTIQPKPGSGDPSAAPARPSTAPVSAPTLQTRQDSAVVTQPQPAPSAAQGAVPSTGAAPALRQGQQIAVGQEKKYTGHPISMDFQGVDLRSVLRTFAEISGLNMVIDPDVQGTVDIVLTDVPWDQALEVILRGNALDYTVDGTIVRIAKVDTLRKEQDARTELARSAAMAGALGVRTYTLSYAKADQAAPLVRSAVLSQRGNVQIDARTNTLIITDLPDRLDTVNQLLTTLDRPEPQVEIEARIITTSRDFARALGVQWGFNGRVNSTIGNTTDLAFPNNGAVDGGQNLAVGGATSAIGLALGSINGAFNLDVALTALERTGKGRILSTPRVITQNNVEAEITQGVQIPVQTVANETVTVTFKDAALSLKVTPQITAANTVIMQITLENAAPGALVEISGGFVPSIDTQRAITRVQVNDGVTTVMGGVFVSREQNTNDKTPGLHRIPLLGWLFKRDSQVDESRELLIFITPRIQKG
jgi:type IV pilus assembly protein PilQ